jgi:hypothetical protein
MKKAYDRINPIRCGKNPSSAKLINRVELNAEQKTSLLSDFRGKLVFLQSFTQDRSLIKEIYLDFFYEVSCPEDLIEETDVK